jgi:hypothetical protein
MRDWSIARAGLVKKGSVPTNGAPALPWRGRMRGLELGNVDFLKSRPNSLVYRKIFLPETFRGRREEEGVRDRSWCRTGYRCSSTSRRSSTSYSCGPTTVSEGSGSGPRPGVIRIRLFAASPESPARTRSAQIGRVSAPPDDASRTRSYGEAPRPRGWQQHVAKMEGGGFRLAVLSSAASPACRNLGRSTPQPGIACAGARPAECANSSSLTL